MHQTFLMLAGNARRTMLAAFYSCLAMGAALSPLQDLRADEPGAISPPIGKRLDEEEDDGFTTISDANTPARLPSPPPAPFRSASPRPLNCCHPNLPRPGEQVHPTLAALAEAVRPGRLQATASPPQAPVDPPPAPLRTARQANDAAELLATPPAGEPVPVPLSASEDRLPETHADKPQAILHVQQAGRQRPPFETKPAETHPLRSTNEPVTIQSRPSASDARPIGPSAPRNFGQSLPPRRFTAPQTAPLGSREPTELPQDVESKVIQPQDVEAEIRASGTTQPEAREPKVINNPWASREGRPAAQHSPADAAEPVHFVRYGDAESRLPGAHPPAAMPGRAADAPSPKPAQAWITAPPARPASVYDRQSAGEFAPQARQAPTASPPAKPSRASVTMSSAKTASVYERAPAAGYAPQARYAASPSPAAEQAQVARSAAQRPGNAVEWQTSEDESGPNPLRGRAPRAAYPAGRWSNDNPLR